MLPMLTVSGGPGLVYLNGRLCGETGVAAMPLAPDGVQYLELKPFDSQTPGAVLRLTLAGGKLIEGVTGDVFAVQWPGGWIAMELRGADQSLAGDPRLLSHLDMPGGRYLLVAEDEKVSFGRNAEEAIFLPVENVLSGSLRSHFMRGLCVAEGTADEGDFFAILKADDVPEIVQCVVGENAHLDGQGVLHVTESVGDLVGHAMVSAYAPDAHGNYSLLSRDPAWVSGGPKWPRSQADTAKAFLEALYINAWTEAAGYLLRPEDMETFIHRIGEFDTVIALPQDGSENVAWGLLRVEAPNMASVRGISFILVHKPDIQGNWKIDSIVEDT